MSFDAAKIPLLVLFSLVICIEFFQSSMCTVPLGVACPCQLRGPGQNLFSQVSFWAAQFPELFSLAGHKGNGKSVPRPDAVGWVQKCWYLAANSQCHTESAQCCQMAPSGGMFSLADLILFFGAICHLFLNQCSYSKQWSCFSSSLLLQLLVEFILYDQPFQLQLLWWCRACSQKHDSFSEEPDGSGVEEHLSKKLNGSFSVCSQLGSELSGS